MKKITTLLFILITMPFYGQWVFQTTTAEYLNDVFCITENIVVVVGDAGTISKTSDGGINWIQKTSNTSQNLKKVQFVNLDIGYAIGDIGTLIKTIDGGESWTTISTGVTNNLTGLSCVNESNFFISGDGPIMKTINGGQTFEVMNTSDFAIIDSIQFLNMLTGYASNLNALYKTTDGGNTWNIIHENDVFSFFFLNENIGFINATNGLSKTIDGGTNFNYLDSISSIQYKLFATSENVIWGVPVRCLLNGDPCYSTRGEITEVGGFQRENDFLTFQSIHFSNPTIGYACYYGSIFKNSTGTLSIENQVIEKDNIQIVPNPASKQFTISFTNNQYVNFSVQITDSLGKTIFFERYLDVNQTTLNSDSFAKGMYFISVVNQEKVQTQKLIIN